MTGRLSLNMGGPVRYRPFVKVEFRLKGWPAGRTRTTDIEEPELSQYRARMEKAGHTIVKQFPARDLEVLDL